MNETLFLSYFADGPVWLDSVWVCAYPTGCSYVLPFEYRLQRVDSAAVELLDKGVANVKDTVIGARFLGDKKNVFLPIRRASLLHYSRHAETFQFYIKVGQMMPFHEVDDLSDLAIIMEKKHEDVLAFLGGDYDLENKFSEEQDEARIWMAFSQKVCDDASLPFNPKARTSIFFYIHPPTLKNGVRAPIKQLSNSQMTGPAYGYQLKEGFSYDLAISHYVPYLEGENTTVETIPLDVSTPNANVELSVGHIDKGGNAKTTYITVSALTKSASIEQFEIRPQKEFLTAQDGKRNVNARKFTLPFGVEISLWNRVKERWLYIVFSWLALTVMGITAIVGNKITDGTLNREFVAQSWWVLVLVLLSSAVASTLLSISKSKLGN